MTSYLAETKRAIVKAGGGRLGPTPYTPSVGSNSASSSCIFRQNVAWRSTVSLTVDLRSTVLFVFHHKVSSSNISRTVCQLESPNFTRHACRPIEPRGYDDISYAGRHFGSSRKRSASDGFGSNFSGAAFCLPPPIGGLLVFISSC